MEIFSIFKGYALEVCLMAIGAFILTYIIKWPIKKATAKFDEEKRKRVNFVILLIPLVLTTISSILYYGIAEHDFFSVKVVSGAISAYLLSLSLYAICSRIWLVIKGFFSGKTTASELSADVEKYLKGKLNELVKENKVDQKDLDSLLKQLEELKKTKDLILSDTICVDAKKLASVNSEIETLSRGESVIRADMEERNTKIAQYKEKLNK